MAVTIYRSTDAGAPVFPASGVQNGAGFLIDLLKACLVNGYGSKPAAGWTIDYEDATAGKRRIGLSNGNGVFEMVTWGTYSIGFFIWDSITTPGTGRIYDDPWATVVSDGVNGWKDELTPAPGAASDSLMGTYAYNFRSGQESEYAWTIYADDKAAWIMFHRPEGSSNTEQGDAIDQAKSSYHLDLFVGAIKSADLARDGVGNLFIGYGGRTAATSANCTSGNHSNIQYLWGLRTPMDTLPATGNNSDYELDGVGFSNYRRNPRSSARLINPAFMVYEGVDVPKPAGLSQTYSAYMFGVLPGLGQMSEGDSGQTYFWVEYNKDRGATWSLEPATIAGLTWFPWSLGTSPFYEVGITDDPAWW